MSHGWGLCCFKTPTTLVIHFLPKHTHNALHLSAADEWGKNVSVENNALVQQWNILQVTRNARGGWNVNVNVDPSFFTARTWLKMIPSPLEIVLLAFRKELHTDSGEGLHNQSNCPILHNKDRSFGPPAKQIYLSWVQAIMNYNTRESWPEGQTKRR